MLFHIPPTLSLPLLSIAFHRALRSDSQVMRAEEKIVPRAGLSIWRQGIRESGRKLVVTNGCFDLLHAGHVTYLQGARSEGDLLLIGVNGDTGVRGLKGPGRPVNCEDDRAFVLAALECVSAVSIFPEVRAIEFLRAAQPDVYVKGGDYTLETLNQEERKVVETGGGRIVFIPFVPGKSTTGLIEKITRL
jgi:rfaE bifunctional protein nucleotidyltransferase chain/domain